MKLSKHQKETIRLIASRDIYDIPTYLKYFNLGCEIKFSKEKITEQFNTDELPKTFYRRKNLQYSRNNTLTDFEYTEKLKNHQLTPEHYTTEDLKLNYGSGIQQKTFENTTYTIDFYEGVYIPNNFNDIVDFLTLWQYLKSEMLILEVPNPCNAQMLGLFFEPSTANSYSPTSLEEKLKCIDYSTLTYEDKYYMQNKCYTFSQEHCAMCKEYMNKKIYPSTKLSLFVKKNFKTYEESSQNRTLFAAWLAIFVSVILTFAPNIQQDDSSGIQTITSDVSEIKELLQTQDVSAELSSKLEQIVKELDSIRQKLPKENEKNSSNKK